MFKRVFAWCNGICHILIGAFFVLSFPHSIYSNASMQPDKQVIRSVLEKYPKASYEDKVVKIPCKTDYGYCPYIALAGLVLTYLGIGSFISERKNLEWSRWPIKLATCFTATGALMLIVSIWRAIGKSTHPSNIVIDKEGISQVEGKHALWDTIQSIKHTMVIDSSGENIKESLKLIDKHLREVFSVKDEEASSLIQDLLVIINQHYPVKENIEKLQMTVERKDYLPWILLFAFVGLGIMGVFLKDSEINHFHTYYPFYHPRFLFSED